MKKMISLLVCLMMLVGCTNNVPSVDDYNASPIRYYSEYQGDGWMYYSVYVEESKHMNFTGVYLRGYNLPGFYMYGYNNGKLVEKRPSSIAHLGVGETTREDLKKIDAVIDNADIYPISLKKLELETLDSKVIEKIVNKTYEQPIVEGHWKHGPDKMMIKRDIGENLVLTVSQITGDEVIIATFIDILDDNTYLRDKEELTDDEKNLVEEFERVEKEMVEKQEYLVIEDSDDPVMHELYLALKDFDMTALREK